MKIAVIQLEIKDEETKTDRIARVESILDGLAGCDLVVLPEIWATGYFTFDKYMEEAEELGGSFTQTFSEKAKSMNLMIFAGSFIEKENDKFFNTSLLFDRNGKLMETYRKVHLFRYGSREGELLTAGDRQTVIQTEYGKVGLATCYDLRFPELFRKQVDLGAEILLVTSAWPHQRLDHWNLFNQVRALENQCYLISCNCVGKTNGVLLGGHSQVVNPWGVVEAKGDNTEMIVRADIDTHHIKEIREDFPQLKHRRMQSI